MSKSTLARRALSLACLTLISQLAASHAAAQTAPAIQGLSEVVVKSQQDAEALPAPAAGGKTARGARLGLLGKMQFMGAHYTGGEDLTKLAGDAAKDFIWATSYYLYDEGTQPGIILAKKIGAQFNQKADVIRSVHYTSGMLAAAIAIEAMKRAGSNINNDTVYRSLIGMVGSKKFDPGFTVGPVTFSAKDHVGAEMMRLLQADSTGNFKAITGPMQSQMFKLVHPMK